MIHHPAVLHAVRDAIFLTDITTGMIVDANPAAEALSGRTLAELRLLHHTELHPPEVERVARSWFEEYPQAPGLTQGLVLHKDGWRIPVEISSSHFTTPDGRRMLVGVFRDLTERKEASAVDVADQKLISDRLRAQTIQFKDAQRLAKVGSWERDVESGCINWSEEMLRIFGQSNPPPTLAAFMDHVHPQDQEKVLACAAEVRSSISPVEVSYRIIRPDGEERFVRAVVEMIRDSQGKPVRTVGSMQDITEHKRAEAALRESEGRFRKVADTAPVMIWLTGPDKSMTFVNKTWLDFRGRTMEQELRDGGAAGIHPDDLERSFAKFNASFDAREAFHVEHRLCRADGEYRWVLCSGVPRFSSEGIFDGYIGSATDITDVRRAEQELVLNKALRESEEKYHGIVETMTEGVWILDSEDRTTFVNQQMASMLGYRVKEMLGRHLLDFKDEEARPMALQKLERRRQGITEQYDSTFRTRDGRRLTALISTRPMWSGEGQYAGTLGIVTDITERSLLEEQLHQAHKMEAIGRLAGGVAHDFNNLLTVINGRCELLLRNWGAGDRIRAELTEIRIAGERAQELTSQMLAFSRGQIRSTEVLNLQDLMEDVERMLTRMIGEDIKLVMVFDSGLGQIKADRTELTQILLNLAANARDAMPAGGTLTFEIRNFELDESHALNHPGARPGAYVLLTVVDTGAGMDAETKKHLFEPFFTTKQPGKGTGLGLATVYGIVSQNKGWILVDSKPNEGTTFRIYWPRVAAGPSKKRDQPAQPEQPLYGYETILVVEDQRQVRELTCAILKEFGYQTLEASHCEEAVRLVEAHLGPLHLLLTDVIMPGISGPELATRLQAMRSLPVLFMSGYSDRREAGQDSEVAYIQKPFTAVALLRKVRELLDDAEHRLPGVQPEASAGPSRSS